MTTLDKDKNLVLGLVSRSKQITVGAEPAPPPAKVTDGAASAPVNAAAPVTTAKMRQLMIRNESKDPIAGKRFRDAAKRSTGIHMNAEHHRKLKLLAVIEDRKFNSYIEEAIEDFMVKIADRLPDVS